MDLLRFIKCDVYGSSAFVSPRTFVVARQPGEREQKKTIASLVQEWRLNAGALFILKHFIAFFFHKQPILCSILVTVWRYNSDNYLWHAAKQDPHTPHTHTTTDNFCNESEDKEQIRTLLI